MRMVAFSVANSGAKIRRADIKVVDKSQEVLYTGKIPASQARVVQAACPLFKKGGTAWQSIMQVLFSLSGCADACNLPDLRRVAPLEIPGKSPERYILMTDFSI